MITPAWTPLRPHMMQSAAYRSRARYIALACGRGSGKSELARRWLVRQLPLAKEWSDPLYFYALPTIAQAKRVAWNKLQALIPQEWIAKVNITDLHIRTVFGSELFIVGMDKPHRLEGVQWDAGIVDESSDQRPGIFDKTLLPAFSHRYGKCWRIGVPKRQGVGAAEFKAFFDRGLSGDDPEIEAYTWPSRDIVTQEEIDAARRKLDERDFAEQYEASWQTSIGGVYYAFDSLLNVNVGVQYYPQQKLIVGSDFNVDPMCWLLCHKVIFDDTFGDSKGLEGLIVVDEIFRRNTNTQATLDYLHDAYVRDRQHKGGFAFIGDAAGRARKTSASTSDYVQIINDNRFGANKNVWYPKANPQISDRESAVNALLCNAARQRRLFIHPRCKRLIADLESLAYKPGTREPNKGGDIGHMADALGYVVYMLWPPIVQQTQAQRISSV